MISSCNPMVKYLGLIIHAGVGDSERFVNANFFVSYLLLVLAVDEISFEFKTVKLKMRKRLNLPVYQSNLFSEF